MASSLPVPSAHRLRKKSLKLLRLETDRGCTDNFRGDEKHRRLGAATASEFLSRSGVYFSLRCQQYWVITDREFLRVSQEKFNPRSMPLLSHTTPFRNQITSLGTTDMFDKTSFCSHIAMPKGAPLKPYSASSIRCCPAASSNRR